MAEVWRKTHDARYEVSNFGRVRSYNKRGGRAVYDEPHLLRIHPDTRGYGSVNIAGRSHRVHRLVAEAFIGPCPPGQEVRHKDDNRMNAHADNLEYGTRTDNLNDMLQRGRRTYKLSADDVRAIRARLARGERQRALADAYSVGYDAINRIHNQKAWVGCE